MRYLITGGAGFIGSNLVDKLISENYDVTVIDNESSDAHDEFYWNKKANNYNYNICDYVMCSEVFNRHKPDVVFHIAAEARIQPCILDPLKAIETNVVGTATILELCRKYNVKRLIYSSTSAAYGLKNTSPLSEIMSNDCLNPYSTSKTCGEELCKIYSKLYNLETIIFRYFNVYGERQPSKGQYAPVIGIFLKQKKENRPLTIVGNGLQKRDFIHVSDIVSANIKAAQFCPPEYINENDIKYTKFQWGEIYNVGTGKNYSVLDVANMIDNKYVFIPERVGEAKNTLADISKIKTHLNWTPKVSLEQWISEHK